MSAPREFVTYVIEDQLAHVSGLSARPMFGGYGVYRDKVMVGIIIDDELYLKVDETNKPIYRAMESTPFSYRRNDGKEVALSYWRVPITALEDKEVLTDLFLDSFRINDAIAAKKAVRIEAMRKKKDHPE